MAKKAADFVIVGSGPGGAAMAAVLAASGLDVVVLERGGDPTGERETSVEEWDTRAHDEDRRLRRPRPLRRPAVDYCTYRASSEQVAAPRALGWVASVVGGGSMLWGGWSLRALPVDLALASTFERLGQASILREWGYAVADWPIDYGALEPYYELTEALFGTCGDRAEVAASISTNAWSDAIGSARARPPDYPMPPHPRTPAGHLVATTLGRAAPKLTAFSFPVSLIHPQQAEPYDVASAIDRVLERHPALASLRCLRPAPRVGCRLCGFCGGYVCWGRRSPKATATRVFLDALRESPRMRLIPNAFAIEILHDDRLGRATGVSYIDTSGETPELRTVEAEHVVVAGGAVPTARLLLLSGARPGGLGNSSGLVGRNAMFHVFGCYSSCTLKPELAALLRAEIGTTTNVGTLGHYFVRDDEMDAWWKGGVLSSSVLREALSYSARRLRRGSFGDALFTDVERHSRTLDIDLIGDDLPRHDAGVDLDPDHVDAFGVPVARITRDFGPHERRVLALLEPHLRGLWSELERRGLVDDVVVRPGDAAEINDHQLGTCRMGHDPSTSVLDPQCRLHDVPNVYVTDSSFMPTGLGVNPLHTIVANALRVAHGIVDERRRGAAGH